MPRLAKAEARRPYSILRPRACQDRLGEHRGDAAQTKYIVRGFRGAHGRRAPAEEGDVWEDGWGQGLLVWTGEGLDGPPPGGPRVVRHLSSKGGARQARRPADGFEGSRTGPRLRCGDGEGRRRRLMRDTKIEGTCRGETKIISWKVKSDGEQRFQRRTKNQPNTHTKTALLSQLPDRH